jgi:hypothetical protein
VEVKVEVEVEVEVLGAPAQQTTAHCRGGEAVVSS